MPSFDPAGGDHLQHLLMDDVVNRDVDVGVAPPVQGKHLRQHVAGKGRHRRHGDVPAPQGEPLAKHLLGVFPVGQQLPRAGAAAYRPRA